MDARSLAASCQLSRRFDAVVSPIRYEYLRLTERICAPQAVIHFPQALDKVYVYTRHVEVPNDLDPRAVKRLLGRIHRLLSVR